MKTLIQILKIIGTSISVGFLTLFITKSNYIQCTALDTFSNSGSFEAFFSAIVTFLIFLGVWLSGILIYSLAKKKWNINLYLYFSIVTIVSLHFFILRGLRRPTEENSELKQSICEKGTDDRMEANFSNLNFQEYHFLNSENWMPDIPKDSDSINIYYYRDSFIGDYLLVIDFVSQKGIKPDLKDSSKWTKNKNRFQYRDSES